MIWNFQPLWIMFSCVSSSKFIEINHCIQFEFLRIPKILFSTPNPKDMFYSVRCSYSFIFVALSAILLTFLVNTLYALFLNFHCDFSIVFFILQARFVIMGFYFLFDHTLLPAVRYPVNNSGKAIRARS